MTHEWNGPSPRGRQQPLEDGAPAPASPIDPNASRPTPCRVIHLSAAKQQAAALRVDKNTHQAGLMIVEDEAPYQVAPCHVIALSGWQPGKAD